MRRSLLVAPLLLLAACGGSADALRPLDAPEVDVVHVVDSSGRVNVIDTAERSLVTNVEGGVPSSQWVFRAGPAATGTQLTAYDAEGRQAWTDRLDGDLSARVASVDGSLVALLPAAYAVTSPYAPGGRSRTTIVVASTEGQAARTFDLEGNFEPEAFTADGTAAFVIEYLPALHPDRYRVRKLDLASGEVAGVPSVDGHLQESMRGTARVSALGADGTRLYTLYTTEESAFVHVLDLEEGWAHCVLLPESLQSTPEAELTVAAGADRVIVADAGGHVASIDPESLEVTDVAAFRPLFQTGPVRAAVAEDGVFVGRGSQVVAFDRGLEVRDRFVLPGVTWSLFVRGDRLWQVTDTVANVVDPRTGDVVDSMDLPTPLPPTVVTDDGRVIQCAC